MQKAEIINFKLSISILEYNFPASILKRTKLVETKNDTVDILENKVNPKSNKVNWYLRNM